MQHSARRTLKWIVVVILVAALGWYLYIQTATFLYGPKVAFTAPENGSTVSEQLVTLEGVAHNVSFIRLNNYPIFVDDHGNFSRQLLLAPGYNIMRIAVEDRFGRSAGDTLELVYVPPAEPAPTTTEPTL